MRGDRTLAQATIDAFGRLPYCGDHRHADRRSSAQRDASVWPRRWTSQARSARSTAAR
ncbi:hypothetical protein ACRAWD_18225 [Caulobacter segnis]